MEGENIIFVCALYGQMQVRYIRKNVMHRNDLFETIKWYIFWGKMHKKEEKCYRCIAIWRIKEYNVINCRYSHGRHSS